MNTSVPFTVKNALAFVAEQGVVLASAKGPVPRLIEFIAGEAIVGNWWSHPHANAIYNILSEVQESDQVLVCKLVNAKVTLVHHRLWPSLARLVEKFAPKQIARVREEHTASGRHVSVEVPFLEWVPSPVLQRAALLSEREARALVGRWVSTIPTPGKNGHKRK